MATSGTSITVPSTWQCIVTACAIPATTHHQGDPPRQARQAAPSDTALESATKFGFQMNVDSSIALALTAMRPAATRPATGPPMPRASHHTAATAATPASAIAPTTTSGSAPERRAAGARR
jgi:hypothetical protein